MPQNADSIDAHDGSSLVETLILHPEVSKGLAPKSCTTPVRDGETRGFCPGTLNVPDPLNVNALPVEIQRCAFLVNIG
jgi:hypothetical protein